MRNIKCYKVFAGKNNEMFNKNTETNSVFNAHQYYWVAKDKTDFNLKNVSHNYF